MKKSLKTYAHMTKDVVHGDCRALFNAVVLQLHPEPRQLLVSCFRQLVKHEKTAAQPYQPWVTGLNDIFNTLDTVDFSLAPHVRLGFTIALLESDKRYAPILEKAQEKEWSNEECQIHFNRHAAKLSDQIKTTRIPHSTNAIGDPPPARTPKGGGKGDRRDTKGGGKGDRKDRASQPPATTPKPPATPTVKPDLSNLETAQKWIDAQRAKRAADQARKTRDPARTPNGSTPCLNYADGRPCFSDPCPFSHIIGPDTTKKADPVHKLLSDSERELAVANRECFMFKATKHCSNGDTCSFKHEANMVITGWAKGTSVTLDTRITNGIANIHTTVLSSKVVKQADGKSPRFYSVVLPTAHLSQLHEQFAYMADSGIHEDFLKVHVPVPQAPVAKPAPQLAPVVTPTPPIPKPTLPTNTCNSVTSMHDLNPCIDNACTFNIINTDIYFIPGTIRESTMLAHFNSEGASAACSTSGLVQLQQENGGILMTGMTNFVRDLPQNLDKHEMKPDNVEMKPSFHKIDSCEQTKRL